MMMTMNNFTQQTIDALKKCPQCLQSLRDIKCYDYEARFGAFIRVKHVYGYIRICRCGKVKPSLQAVIWNHSK